MKKMTLFSIFFLFLTFSNILLPMTQAAASGNNTNATLSEEVQSSETSQIMLKYLKKFQPISTALDDDLIENNNIRQIAETISKTINNTKNNTDLSENFVYAGIMFCGYRLLCVDIEELSKTNNPEEKEIDKIKSLQAERTKCEEIVNNAMNQIEINEPFQIAKNFSTLFNYLNMESSCPHNDSVTITTEFLKYVRNKLHLKPLMIPEDLGKNTIIIDIQALDQMAWKCTTKDKDIQTILKPYITQYIQEKQETAQYNLNNLDRYLLPKSNKKHSDFEKKIHQTLEEEERSLLTGWDTFKQNNKQKIVGTINNEKWRDHSYITHVAIEALYKSSNEKSLMRKYTISAQAENLYSDIPHTVVDENFKKNYKTLTQKCFNHAFSAIGFGTLAIATYHKLLYANLYNNTTHSWKSNIITGIGAFITISTSMIVGLFRSQKYFDDNNITRVGNVAKIICSPIASAVELTQCIWSNVQRSRLLSEANEQLNRQLEEIQKVTVDSEKTKELLKKINNPETIIICEQ